MISRAIVIAIAFIAAGYRATEGAWMEATGLAALGGGLLLLKLAGPRPYMKRWAWLLFLLTAVTVTISLWRRYQ
jgi:hypothetical protein